MAAIPIKLFVIIGLTLFASISMFVMWHELENIQLVWDSFIGTNKSVEQTRRKGKHRVCIENKMNDKSNIIWKNESDCDGWSFTNKNDKIYNVNESLKILSNTTLILFGNSVDRRLAYTLIEWMYKNHTIHWSDYSHGSLRLLDVPGTFPEAILSINNLKIFVEYQEGPLNETYFETYSQLISMTMRDRVKTALSNNKKVILLVSMVINVPDGLFMYYYNVNLNETNCDKEIHLWRYPLVNNKIFDECWELNLKNNSLIWNPMIKYWYKKIINAINIYYNYSDNTNFKIIFRSYMAKSFGYDGFHPYTSNKQGLYFTNNEMYRFLCEELTINYNQWKFINMYELFLNKTSYDRLNCFGQADYGVHLQDLGRYVYAQKFINTVHQFAE